MGGLRRSQSTTEALQRAARRAGLLAALTGVGLALGACSKCDVPNLLPKPPAPQSCHEAPAPN